MQLKICLILSEAYFCVSGTERPFYFTDILQLLLISQISSQIQFLSELFTLIFMSFAISAPISINWINFLLLKLIMFSNLVSIFGSILFPSPSVFYDTVTNYMLLYSTLPCEKIARAPGGRKKFFAH